MESARAFFRTLRAIFAYYGEAASDESYKAAVDGDRDSCRRLNRISDRYKALLLASPGR